MNAVDGDGVDLVRRARQGDVDAFSDLVEQHWRRLVGFARSVVGDGEAEDVVQDSFMIGWQKIKSLKNPDAFVPWMTRIVARACFRRCKRQRNHVTLDCMAEFGDPRGNGAVEQIHVHQVLQTLAPRQRAVMHCTVVEGMSDSEIGTALGITAGSVRSHRRRARERLQQVLPAGNGG